MNLIPLQTVNVPKQVVLVEQRYPYGKNSIYMPTAVIVVAAQLIAAGHSVEIVDFNIDNPEDVRVTSLFGKADIIGVAVIGAPYIPQTIELCRRFAVQFPKKQVMVGGQVISRLSAVQFARLFVWTNAIRIGSVADYTLLFGNVPEPYLVSLIPVYRKMGERLKLYLRREFPLWFSQGCAFNCDEFCTAERNQVEQFHSLKNFQEGIEYLVATAKQMGLPRLGCYASSLDFFQNPATVEKYLKVMAVVRKSTSLIFGCGRCLAW